MRHWAIASALAWLAVTGARADQVVIGAITPLGPGGKAAVETALEVVNGKHAEIPVVSGQGGGLDRLGGATVRAVFGDDAGDAGKAAAEAERLVSAEHAVALIGGGTDAAAAAIDAVAERHHLPFLSPLRSPSHEHDLSWFFRLAPTPDITAASIFGFLGDRAKSVALVWDDTEAGRASAEAERKAAAAAGATIVADLKVTPEAPALEAEALVIAGAKPDVVIAPVGVRHAAGLVRAIAEQHVSPIVALTGGSCVEPSFPSDAGAAAEGVFCASGYVGGRPGLAMVEAMFRQRSGAGIDAQSAQVLTGALLLADVINRAGTTKPIELRAALMDTNTPGEQTLMAWQGIRFDDAARNVLATPAIVQVQGGAFKTVAPDGLATAAAVWK